MYRDKVQGLLSWCKENNKNKLVYLRGIIDYCYDNGYNVKDLEDIYTLNSKFFYDYLIHIVKFNLDLLDTWHNADTLDFYKNMRINEIYSSIVMESLDYKGSLDVLCNARGVKVGAIKRYLKFLPLVDYALYERYMDKVYKGKAYRNVAKYKYYEDKLQDYLCSDCINLSLWCRDVGLDYVDFQNYIKHILSKVNIELYDEYRCHRGNIYMLNLSKWLDTDNISLCKYLGSTYNAYRVFINTKLEGLDKDLYSRVISKLSDNKEERTKS